MRPDGLPFRHLLGFAVAVLGWSPDTFWRATPQDVGAALDFLRDTHTGLDSDTVAALKERLKKNLEAEGWNSTS